MKDDSEDDLSSREIEILNRLIRECREDETLTDPPDDSLLSRYVQGNASAAEVERVQEALARSPELREEVAYLASLYEPDAQARFDAVQVPAREREISNTSPAPGGSIGDEPFQRSRSAVSRKPRWIAAGVSVAAAASLFVGVWLFGSNRGARWTLEAELTPGAFEHEVYRGTDAPDFPEPEDHADAATIAFLRVAEWKDGSLQLNLPSAGPPEAGQNVTVSIQGDDERYTIALPADAQDLQLWYLAMPSLKTFRTPVHRQELHARQPPEKTKGLLTITYRVDGRFAATSPREVDLR